MSSSAELMVAALQLQRTRCETYRLWEAKFHCALEGALSVSDFETAVTGSIVAAFQRVSTSLRMVQQMCKESDDGSRRFLDVWIDELQTLEQEHYCTSVQMAQLIVQHCEPSVHHDEKQKAEPTSVPTGEATKGKPEDSSDPSIGKPEMREEPGVQASNESMKRCDGTCSSLHDTELCELRRLIPLRAQCRLTYVTCQGDFSHCSWDGDLDDGDDMLPDGAASRKEELLVPFVHKSGDALFYSPHQVWRRCAEFNGAVVSLKRKQQRLRQLLDEKIDELQEEITTTVPTPVKTVSTS
uniref:Uncharacterized protein n=1 Tax=Trypanosoma congolense (strain IL3000) TaxID=1068625 RepID=G0UJX8_TRYCI|nr:conserved hypothetical protein [Trypanosoma congolense IL3000]